MTVCRQEVTAGGRLLVLRPGQTSALGRLQQHHAAHGGLADLGRILVGQAAGDAVDLAEKRGEKRCIGRTAQQQLQSRARRRG